MKSTRIISAACVAAALALVLSARSALAEFKPFGVTLTRAQQEQFKAIHAAAEPAKKAVRENAALSQSEKQAQMKAIYDGIKEKLKAILTPEQVQEMHAAQKKN